jgi:predicted alpha/beta-fold hydrolase
VWWVTRRGVHEAYPCIARHGVYGELSSRHAPRLRQWAEEGVWRAKVVSTRSVGEFISEMRGSTATYDGHWSRTTHENRTNETLLL